MNFKRKKPKTSRSGCLLCNPQKIMGNSNGAKTIQTLRSIESFNQQISIYREWVSIP